jgi:predicted membrane protein
LTLSVDGVMSNLTLDLKELTVYNLETDAVMGNYVIEMPQNPGLASATIKGVFSNVEIVIPQGVAVSITVNSVFGDSEVDQNRFPQKGASYVSPDYDTATNKINLKVDSTFGRVSIR